MNNGWQWKNKRKSPIINCPYPLSSLPFAYCWFSSLTQQNQQNVSECEELGTVVVLSLLYPSLYYLVLLVKRYRMNQIIVEWRYWTEWRWHWEWEVVGSGTTLETKPQGRWTIQEEWVNVSQHSAHTFTPPVFILGFFCFLLSSSSPLASAHCSQLKS